jgi:magnesium transporter
MGKKSKSFFSFRRRSKKLPPPQPPPSTLEITGSPSENPLVLKPKKKTGGAKLWMRFDRSGTSELVEWEKNTIIRHAAIPARDLRILGPVFSHSSNILGNSILGFHISLHQQFQSFFFFVLNFLKFRVSCFYLL